MMPQKEFDGFPQGCLAEFADRLRVFLDGHMQSITGRESLPRRHEAFQFWRGHRFHSFRVI